MASDDLAKVACNPQASLGGAPEKKGVSREG
jgi:hypothetical protein